MNIKVLTLNLFISILFSSCEEEVNKILKMSFQKCQSINSGYYEMHITDNNEPQAHSYVCSFKKIANDSVYSSIFHSKESVMNKLKAEVIYTGDDFVRIEPLDSSATVLSKSTLKRDFRRYCGTHLLYSPLVNRSSEPLPSNSDFSDGKHTFKFIGKEIINNTSCYHIQGNEKPEDEPDSPMKTLRVEFHLWISEKDSIPIQFAVIAEGLQHNDTLRQNTKYSLEKYELNRRIDSNTFTLESIPTGYKIVDYSPKSEYKPLSLGEDAPDWNLPSLKNENVRLSDFKNKVVLLDFFFKGCYPCVKSMPGLQALHNKYYSKGLRIIGIDAVDESKTELTTFLEKKGVSYTILTEGAKVEKDYHVSSHPAIYLIDKKGKIIFTERGFDDDLEHTLGKLLADNL